MNLDELDYELPPERIAQAPADRRDASRLLVLDRAADPIRHARFRDLPAFLRAGDLLVVNDTRVVPARFFARRATGGQVEGLFLSDDGDGHWTVLLKPSRRVRAGEVLTTTIDAVPLRVVSALGDGAWRVRPASDAPTWDMLDRFGTTPLPPYIKRDSASQNAADRERYQTVYANARGSVAAPTAGLHFTDELLVSLRSVGVDRAGLTLHVGLGTFQPVSAGRLEDHPMHREWYRLPEATARRIDATRAAGGRIVAVGTTSARVLETCARPDGTLEPGEGWTDLLIQPPYAFRAVDALITNFHLPRSTLLALVFALAGRDHVRRAYEEAIREGYRFYSFGDAMLIV